MDHWLERVKENLFPLSLEKRNIKVALKEWEYAGNMYDLETDFEDCQLCGHKNIRFQFQITNIHNQNDLLIGSECVTRFGGISVLDEAGNALPYLEAKKKVSKDRRKLVTNAQTRSLLNSLVELGRVDQEFDISSFEEDYKQRGYFTPKQLVLLIWRFEKHKVPFNKSYFNISIKRGKDKLSLLAMENWQLKRLWGCLSPSQRKWLRARRT